MYAFVVTGNGIDLVMILYTNMDIYEYIIESIVGFGIDNFKEIDCIYIYKYIYT